MILLENFVQRETTQFELTFFFIINERIVEALEFLTETMFIMIRAKVLRRYRIL